MNPAPTRLSPGYQRSYVRLLERIAATPAVRPRELAVFWPKVGDRYDGELLVVGRAVNGWIDRWSLDEPGDHLKLADTARATGKGTVNGDQLGWILDRWKARDGGCDTSTSQFWETVRRVIVGLDPEAGADWPSRIAWTNLCKVAPWAGGNPGSHLLSIQRELAPELLRTEIDELAPRRVVAFTGRWWFEPFAAALDLDFAWRDGLVQGVADDRHRRYVVAVHPMTRSPKAVGEAVRAAFDDRVAE